MKKKIMFALILGLAALCFAAETSHVTIDMRFNVLDSDARNYFNWSSNGKTVKDGYDAESGASKSNSTFLFDSIRYDSMENKKTTIPAGLRCLVLFPLSNYITAEVDDFTVLEVNKQILIRFIHRGVAYQIKSDKKGKINLNDSFYYAPGVGENIGGLFIIKKEYLIPGGNPANMSDVNWAKVPFVKDVPSAEKKYSGTLSASLKKNILYVKGRISIQK